MAMRKALPVPMRKTATRARARPMTAQTILSARRRSFVEKMVEASNGYDLPSFANFTDFKTWAEEGPPKGTLYHYPNINNHQILSIAGAPAPHKIGEQIYVQALQTQMPSVTSAARQWRRRSIGRPTSSKASRTTKPSKWVHPVPLERGGMQATAKNSIRHCQL